MLLDRVEDPNALIAKLLREVQKRFSLSPRGGHVCQSGVLTSHSTDHKKEENEMGGLRFVVSTCGSNRPAAVLLFTPHDSNQKAIEMLHWYVAQGWSRQHHYQRVMLCRVRDFELAQVVVDVIKDSLHIFSLECSLIEQGRSRMQKNAQLMGFILYPSFIPIDNTRHTQL